MENVYAKIISVSLMLTTLCGAGLNMRCTNSIVKELLETIDTTLGECKEEMVFKATEKAYGDSSRRPMGFLKNAFAKVSAELSKFCKRYTAKRYEFDCKDIAASTRVRAVSHNTTECISTELTQCAQTTQTNIRRAFPLNGCALKEMRPACNSLSRAGPEA